MGVSVGTGVSVGIGVLLGIGVSVGVFDGVKVGGDVFVGVYVAVAVLVGVCVGMGVKVSVFGMDVFLGTKLVEVGRLVGVVVTDGASEKAVFVRVRAGVGVNVGAETISENASTVSTMTVLMFATKKSTTPTAGVPAWAAWLMSLTPTIPNFNASIAFHARGKDWV